VALARELLTSVIASGHERSGMLATELAESILSAEAVALALDVRAGGPLCLRKAVDLASLLLSQDARQRHELPSSEVKVDPAAPESGATPSATGARQEPLSSSRTTDRASQRRGRGRVGGGGARRCRRSDRA